MIDFAELYRSLDETTKTNAKIRAMADYLGSARPEDAAWAIYFLSGNRLSRLVKTGLLRSWAAEVAGIQSWLLDESYHAVGDLAETLTLIVPEGRWKQDIYLADFVEKRLQPLRSMDEPDQKHAVLRIWRETNREVRFVTMKLITGAFRVGVSKRLVTRAVAECADLSPEVIAHRLMGDWNPTPEAFHRLIDPQNLDAVVSQPYPFCLAHPINSEAGPADLGDPAKFVAEWKWDGIRGQLVRREGETFLWSRGEELMENRWPEIERASEALPNGTVLDGEILAREPGGAILPFAQLQRRIGRKKVGKKLLAEVPVAFHVFDLLEHEGVDLRDQPWHYRRHKLECLLDSTVGESTRIVLNELIHAESWGQWAAIRETSRDRLAEGLMLKRRDAQYDVGRVRGTWWKWKVDPFSIDAVLIYAQKGHGKRANLFTDYTFALWNDDVLVPFAKAYSGLNDQEIRQVDRFVRDHTNESFGPVRSVTPMLVMELAFEGLQRSNRHKSGIATRFPRIVRWRHDKKPEDANTLSELKAFLPNE